MFNMLILLHLMRKNSADKSGERRRIPLFRHVLRSARSPDSEGLLTQCVSFLLRETANGPEI